MVGGMNLHQSLCHTFGTMATGGYSTLNKSVGGFNSAYIDYVIIIFMILAGMNFSLHYRMLKGNVKEMFINRESQFYFAIIGFATLVIGIDTYINNYSSILETLRYTLFQVVSIITTTGFGTADYEQWSISSQLVLFLLMFIGGMAGSTGGGMKVMRIYLLFKFVYAEIVRLVHPQAIVPVRMGNITVNRDVMMNVLGFFVLYMLIAAFSSLYLSFYEIDIATSIGAVAATLNNIGPGLELVGPTDNYAFLPSPVKWHLSFLMLLGRLEVYTVVILLAPSFWQK
jgi:trk system potassium uptake protein TrkH